MHDSCDGGPSRGTHRRRDIPFVGGPRRVFRFRQHLSSEFSGGRGDSFGFVARADGRPHFIGPLWTWRSARGSSGAGHLGKLNRELRGGTGTVEINGKGQPARQTHL